MARYNELLERYKRRKNETLVDSLTTALTCVDEVAVGLGLLDSAQVVTEVIDNVFDVVPFVAIAVSEGSKVMLRKKKVSSAVKDASYRVVKTGTAMAVGAGMVAAGGGVLALPASMSVRIFFDRYKSKLMLARRLEDRIAAMNYLNQKWNGMDEEILLLPAAVNDL